MCQLRRVALLAFILMMTASLAYSAETTDLIPLGPESTIQTVSVDLAGKTASGMTLRFRAPYLEVSDREKNGTGFQLISLPGGELDGAEGRPALPLVTRLVAIPDGQTLQVVEFKTRDTSLEGAFNPWPAQGLKAATDPSFSQDATFYQGAKQEPAPALVSVGEPSLVRGVRVVPVRFRPVTWTPGDGSLNVAAEIDVTFDLVASADGRDSGDAGRLIPQSFAAMYEREIIGYQARGEAMEGPGTYLLIHPDNATVLANLDPLIAWRQRQGYNVVVASTAQTGTTTGSIKSFIQNQYDNLSIPLEFVTLVGDATGSVAIPTYIESLSGYGGEGDHEYTRLEGGDVLADIHIGRLSVTSTTMLADVVAKIVDYESAPYMDDDLGWFTRAGLSGDPSSSGYSCIWVNQWVKQQLLELNYTQVDTIWSGDFATQIFNTVNQGETLFTYRGYWGMSGLHTGYIDAMDNKDKLPFALIVTCDTGSFRADVSCQSEAFFRNANGGAVGSMGTATIGTHTRYNNCMFQGVAEGLLNSGDPRFGPSLTLAKLHLYQNYYDVEPDKVTIWSTWNNLMGDPATAMWSAVPSLLTVDYPDSLSIGANNLPVTVTSGGQPQSGALVTIFGEGQVSGAVVQVSAVTGADGQVNLLLSGLEAGEYQVTVTGRNLKPYLGGVNVGEVAAAVNFAALTVDDDNNGSSSGNGDAVVNPGETVELMVDLINNGTGGVNDVTGLLGSGHELVIVDQATADFGFIGSGATVTGQQSYVISLDPAVRGGSQLLLELVADDGTRSWTSLVDLTVSGPAAQVVAGSLSGRLDPGGSASLEVELDNSGDLATAGITATLSSDSYWISVSDPDGTYGAISAGASGTNSVNPFTLQATNDCFPGHVATLTLDLVFAEGGTASLPVLVTVGAGSSTDPAGPDRHGYYAFDNTDTGYPLAPTYDWVEISPDRGGPGTSVGLTDFGRWQDDVVIMPLPFPFTYYGQTFTEISVCANGWISMGGTDQRLYRNWSLPSLGTPDNMIAVYWDDLHDRGANSGIFSWYDAANNRLIIEWDNVGNSVNTGISETFQVILNDPAHGAGDTGDGIITMNFKDINPTDYETGFGTVGIQNEDRDDAVLITYFGLYPLGAATVTDGRSITFRTVIPQAQGTLRGLVTNTTDDGPVEGASVNVIGRGLNLLSAADGNYQGSLVIGTYDVAVYHPSFAADTTFGVVITEATETVVDFALTDIAGPLIELQTMPESTGDTAGPYDVVFKVTDFSGIQETRFFYTSSDGGGPFELTPQAEPQEDTWRVSIPGQPDGTVVQYWLTSLDQLDLTTSEPAGAPFDVHSFTVAQTTIVYSSDMETDDGWVGGAAGDDATTGLWTRVDPNGVFESSLEVSPEDDHSDPGTMCWVTGNDPVGSQQGTDDVDGGTTTLLSPVFDIVGFGTLDLQYHRWYTNDTGFAPGEDHWVVQAQAQDGSWVNLENTSSSNRIWQEMNFRLADHLTLGTSTQIRFVASDLNQGSVVEAAVDDFSLTSVQSITDGEAPQVSLTGPDGSGVLEPGTNVEITWTQSDDIGVVHVELLLSTDSGASYDHPIAAGPLNGTFDWTVPELIGLNNRIKVICHDSAGNSTAAASAEDIKIGFVTAVGDLPTNRLALAQNSPNPFNPRTEISFSVPSRQDVTLRIYNVEGRLVRTLLQGVQEAGVQTVVWSGMDDQGKQTASGLYFYRLITDGGTLTRKMTLLK